MVSAAVTREFAGELARTVRRRGKGAVAAKRVLLEALAHRAGGNENALRECEGALLFLCAYPDSLQLRDACDQAMDDIAGEIAEGEVIFAASWHLANWLVARFPNEAFIDWDNPPNEDTFADFLESALLATERDLLISQQFDQQRQLALLAGTGVSELQGLITAIRGMTTDSVARERVYSMLGVWVGLRFENGSHVRSRIRLPQRDIFVHPGKLKKSLLPRRVLALPVPDAAKLRQRERLRLIDTARMSLVVRGRETDPVTFADERSVALYRLDRGIDVALFEMMPRKRLAFDAYVGFVAAKNGVPVAYGGAWIFLQRMFFGINIFPEFRGGESSVVMAQILRVYYQRFGVADMFVEPYQVGADNEDGIRSGAFWFYYRFGFRPLDQDVSELARNEWRLMQADRRYECPTRTLKRLTSSTLALSLEKQAKMVTPDIADIALAVNETIDMEFAGDRRRARIESARLCERSLGISSMKNWPANERESFIDLSIPVYAGAKNIVLNRTDQRQITAVMRAKGGRSEARFVQLSRDCAKWRQILQALAVRGSSIRADEA